MERWKLNACVEGYEDRLLDEQTTAVYTGYWSAYYTNKRGSKNPVKIIQGMLNNRYNKKKKGQVPDVDVDAFKKAEAQFKAKQKAMRGED
jgi:hypothetical protein